MYIKFQKVYSNNFITNNNENINKNYNTNNYNCDNDYKLMSDSISATRKSEVSFGVKKVEIPSEIQKRILDEYKAGKSTETIFALLSGIFAISIYKIERFIKEQTNIDEIKAEHDKNKSSFTKEQIEEMKQMYREGMKSIDIAKKFKINIPIVMEILKKDAEEYKQILAEHDKNSATFKATDEQKEEIKQMYRDGMIASEVAKKFKCGVTTVFRIIKKDKEEYKQILAEHDKNATRFNATNEQKAEIKKMYRDGMSYDEIAQNFKCSATTVMNILKEDKEEYKQIVAEHEQNAIRFKATDEQKVKMKQMFREGLTSDEIAEKFGCSPTTVMRILKKDEEEYKQILAEHDKNAISFKATDEQIEEIKQMYINGMSSIEIAKNFKCNATTVMNILKEDKEEYKQILAEHDKNATRFKATGEKKAEMKQLYREGMTSVEIAKKFKTNSTTVMKIIKKDKEEFKQILAEHDKNSATFKATDEQKEEIKQMYRDGITFDDIAKKFRCGETTIEKIIKENQEEYKQILAEHDKNSTCFKATDEQKAEIKQMYRDGMIASEVAKKFKCGVTTVFRIIKKDKEEYKQILAEHDKKYKQIQIEKNKKNTYFKATDEQKAEIKQMYRDGMSYDEIAQNFKCSKTTVKNILKVDAEEYKQILAEHDRNATCFKATDEQIEKIKQMYRDGLIASEVAKKFKCGVTTVFKIIKKDKEEYKQILAEHDKNYTGFKATDEQKKEIKKMYRDGMIASEVAKKFKCDVTTVFRIIKKDKEEYKQILAEHDKNATRFNATNEQKAEIKQMYRDGMTSYEIAENIKCSQATVMRILKKDKEEYKQILVEHDKNATRFNATNEQKAEMKQMYRDGMTSIEIAENFKCSQPTVIRILKKDKEEYKQILAEHDKNYLGAKNKRIEKILELDNQGFSYKEIQKQTNENISFIRTAIQVRKHHADFRERLGHRYNEYKFEDLIDRVVEFLINDNSVQNEHLINIIEFLDNKKSCTEEEKEVLIQFCKELDKIENDVTKADEIIKNSQAIDEISQWMEDDNLQNEWLEDARENLYNAIHLLSANQLNDLYDIVENFRPDNKENIEKIDFANEISKFINDKLNSGNITNKDRNYVKNVIIFYDSLKSKDDESIELLCDAVDYYNSIYDEKLNLEEMEDLTEEQQERIGQIISIIDMVNNSYNDTLGNDYIKFAKLFQNKTGLNSTKVINILTRLENFFNTPNSQASYIRFNDEFGKDLFGEDIVKTYLNEIYSYNYENVGPNNINAILKKEVLEDKNWAKLTKKEQLDFIRTLEMAKVDLSVSSSGNFNIIKGEGKLNCLIKDEQTNKIINKPVQIVELKILSKWRIFGYVDPKTNQYVFDKLGLDGSDGLDSYKKNFANQHSFV